MDEAITTSRSRPLRPWDASVFVVGEGRGILNSPNILQTWMHLQGMERDEFMGGHALKMATAALAAIGRMLYKTY